MVLGSEPHICLHSETHEAEVVSAAHVKDLALLGISGPTAVVSHLAPQLLFTIIPSRSACCPDVNIVKIF